MEFMSEITNGLVAYLTLNTRLWQALVLLLCTLCSFATARLLSRTHKKNILYVFLPVTVFILLSIIHAMSLVSATFFNFANTGTVTGVIMSITPAVFKARKLVVIVRRSEELSSEVVFDDFSEVTTRSLHAQIAESLVVAPAHLKMESGRGSFVDDLDSISVRNILRPLPGTAEVEKAICYVRVVEDDIVPLGHGSKRANSKTSIVSLLTNKLPPKLNVRAEVRLGALVHMIGKMPNAADAGSAFSLSCVQTYAAATTNSSAKYMGIKFHPWNNQGGGAGNDVDDGTSIGGLSTSTPDDGPIRCGSTVVIECEGKFLTVIRGKWLCWNSATPRRSGAFSVEIWQKSKERDHRLSKLSHMLSMTKLNEETPTPGTSSSTVGKIAPSGEVLRSGDYFRLRSVKFPEMEIGVTNVRLEKDYFYLGFAKVDDVGGNGWSMPLRMSVKIM